MQEDNLAPVNPVFERLRRYQVTQNLTWKSVGEKLGVSVAMLMSVKSGKRSLSAKVLYKLDEAEREAASRKSEAERVVSGLLNDEGKARALVQIATRRAKNQPIPVDYINQRRSRSLPEAVKLTRPSENACSRLKKIFADTLDSQIVLLACLPPDHRTEAFLKLLTPTTLSRLQAASLELIFGDTWRLKLAQLAIREPAKTEND